MLLVVWNLKLIVTFTQLSVHLLSSFKMKKEHYKNPVGNNASHINAKLQTSFPLWKMNHRIREYIL